MSELHETTFAEADKHLVYACGLKLEQQLVSNRWHRLTAWSILAPLIVLYRYSELLTENIKIYDMVAEGHKSHLSGTDLDFGYAGETHRKKAVHQARIVHDMLELKDAIRAQSSRITSFRLGFYFDRFDNDDNLKKMQKADDKVETFNDLYKHRTGISSLHLGVRYDFNQPVYHGNKFGKGAGKFGFWGQSGEGYGRGMRWAQVFKNMDGNLPTGQVDRLASKILYDFATLDYFPPNVAHGRDPVSDPVWV